MSDQSLANAWKVMVSAGSGLATVRDVDGLLNKIREQVLKWHFFTAELWHATVQGKKHFKIKIFTSSEVVYGSSMSFGISGAEGGALNVEVAYGPGGEQSIINNCTDLAKVKAKATRWIDVLNEFTEICDLLESLVSNQLNERRQP